MSKTNAQRAKEWREEQKRKSGAPMPIEPSEGPIVLLLREQVADLQRRLDASEKRHSLRDERDAEHTRIFANVCERFANVTERSRQEFTVSASGLGGLGGLSSGSPSPSSSLQNSEKPSTDREFQDLNGKTRAYAVLSNGTRVPGVLSEANDTRTFANEPNGIREQTEREDGIFDSQKSETRTRKTLLEPPLPGHLTQAEIERRRADQLRALEAMEAGK